MWRPGDSREPNLSIHREASEHEVDVPALCADVAHTVHMQLHVGWLWRKTGKGEVGTRDTRQHVCWEDTSQPDPSSYFYV